MGRKVEICMGTFSSIAAIVTPSCSGFLPASQTHSCKLSSGFKTSQRKRYLPCNCTVGGFFGENVEPYITLIGGFELDEIFS